MLVYSLDDLSQFTDFQTARQTQGEVHILGEWVKRNETQAGEDFFRFYMRDSNNTVQLVHYSNPKPTNIDQAERVYIIGQYNGDVFHAKKIFMKCPSKYEDGANSIAAGEAHNAAHRSANQAQSQALPAAPTQPANLAE
jgi:cytochrome c-type biogenesis protein CcmE